ncbi:hypothetical protein [Paraburkholderia diazotrophica]|uniref:Uncharacterized protein n=1 Tax=Paraburkholderia diazotrophica TaxID=667676 RepID=A0A1H6TNB0_9BURK|nr:hypothetical protein [Paraburkholderia diazotrophica]SEI81563.1 hypothetical protein SAMN05192539_1004196 [Paraburkholderia diazotrophica]
MTSFNWFDPAPGFDPATLSADDVNEVAAGMIDPWFTAMGWESFRSDERGIEWDPPCDVPTEKQQGLRAFWDRRVPARVTVCANGQALDCASPFELVIVLLKVAQHTGIGRFDAARFEACCGRFLLLGNASIELARQAVADVFAERQIEDGQREIYRRLDMLGDRRRSAYARRDAG